MLAFRTRGGASFFYRAEFSRMPYANISFFDRDRTRILFHLSLRLDDGLAVCNRRGVQVDGWGRETKRRVRLSAKHPANVEIRFAPPGVSVWLDGQRIFRFGQIGLRRFPGLAGIGYVDVQGGISAAGIDIDTSGFTAEDGITITDRLELRGRLPLPAGTEALQLGIEDVPDSPSPILWPLAPGAGPGPATDRRMGVKAILPGRIWAGLPEGAPLRMRLQAPDGTVQAETSLERDTLLALVESALTGIDLEGDAFAAMQVAEHVHFAGLEPRLSPPARAAFAAMAAFYRLDGFLSQGLAAAPGSSAQTDPDMAQAPEAGPALPEPSQPGLSSTDEAGADARPASDPDPEQQLERLHAALARRLADDPGADLSDALGAGHEADAPELPPRLRQKLYLLLAEPFCLSGRFAELFALMQQEGLPLPAPEQEIWHDTALMPFLWQAGQLDALGQLLWKVVDMTGGWPVTPAIAWVIERALEARNGAEAPRDSILYGFTAFLERRAEDYWSRTPCQALTRAAARLTASLNRLADYATTDQLAAVLRVYGLSRAFWDTLDSLPTQTAQQTPHALQLSTLRKAFRVLENHASGHRPATPEQLSEALQPFRDLKVAGRDRVARELLGPSRSVSSGSAPTAARLLQVAPTDPGEPALRHLACPGAATGDEALAELAAEAMAGCYGDISRAPYRRLQIAAARQITAWTAPDAHSALPDTEAIDTLAADLALLASDRSEYLGIGLGLVLLDGLMARGDTAPAGAAEHLSQHLVRLIAAMPDTERRALWQATAPRMALQAMRRRHPEQAIAALTLPNMEAPATGPLPEAPFPAAPLFDTVVTVFSCLPNLDTRVAAMRDSWLARLGALGIPYVVIVGNGDGRLEGDVVHVDAPDDYEGLPLKTLATIRWVHEHTPYSHMIKVDDDCFIDPDRFFGDLAFRKFDYYGRSLTRHFGQMDRTWHCAKSSSARGRHELDKSPEPSTYTDGGSGYALSRRAMAAAIEAADSPEGQHLIQVSFMEDKLLGDLLALCGIAPSNEDYHISVRRRTGASDTPVSLWVNGFDPSRAAPVKLVHLDGHLRQQSTLSGLNSGGLTPKKIWPSYMGARLGFCSNALEMVSPLHRLEAAREAEVAVVACQRNELFILPHFLDHYRRMGVGAFLIADNVSDDGTLEYLAEQPDVALFSVDTDYSASQYGVAWQQALLSSFRMNRWSVVADADEFLVWQDQPGGQIADLLATPEFEDAEAARIFMLDMYPGGPLEEAAFTAADPFAEAGFVEREPFLQHWPGQGPFSDSPVWTSALRHRLIPQARPDLFVAQKYALLRYRPWMRLSAGLHFLTDIRLAQRELFFAHFKYNANFHAKARDEVSRRQHFNNAEEYRKYLALASEGRSLIHDPQVSVPWTEAPFVRARLGGATT